MHLLAVTALALAAVVPPDDVPPPGSVRFEVVVLNGPACPGPTQVTFGADNRSFEVDFGDSFFVEAGPGTKPGDLVRRCEVHVGPIIGGWTYGIRQVDHSGWAGLSKGARASMWARHSFSGLPGADRNHQFKGPIATDWQITDEAPEIIYHPCGGSPRLKINADLRMNAGTSDPATHSELVPEPSTYRLAWKRCQ